MKSVSDCLNFNDDAIVENFGKYFGISILDDINKYLLERGQSELIEERVALSNVLRQTNSIIENYYHFGVEDVV